MIATSLRLDIWQFYRNGLLAGNRTAIYQSGNAGSMKARSLEWNSETLIVEFGTAGLTIVKQPNACRRFMNCYYFLCPCCEAKCRLLFWHNGTAKCKRCHNSGKAIPRYNGLDNYKRLKFKYEERRHESEQYERRRLAGESQPWRRTGHFGNPARFRASMDRMERRLRRYEYQFIMDAAKQAKRAMLKQKALEKTQWVPLTRSARPYPPS